MSQTVGDYLLERLATWGVKRIYGYPGRWDQRLMGAFDARARLQRPEFIQARHEEMAAFMACGHAKFTGEVGVCMATSGPGAIHLLNGLYDAKSTTSPSSRSSASRRGPALGGNYQQEVDLHHAVQGRRPRIRSDGDGARADPPPDRPRVRIALAERTVTA